jgi:protein involved in polysaccharide export with SLBB domain
MKSYSRLFLTVSLSISTVLMDFAFSAPSWAVGGSGLGAMAGSFDPSSIPAGVSPEDLQQFLQMTGKGGGADTITDNSNSDPMAPKQRPLSSQGYSPLGMPPSYSPLQNANGFNPQNPAQYSVLEKLYQNRIPSTGSVVHLTQFGYDIFSNMSSTMQGSDTDVIGSVQGNYVLGIGDKISVTLRGQQNSTGLYVVDREGRVVIRDLKPLEAAGHTFEEFQQSLDQAVKETLGHTEAYVSLSKLRQINISVTGEVQKPNAHLTLTSLSSVMDALTAAGGIKRSGSLRQIKLIHKGQVVPIDFYDILLGSSSNISQYLADGDQIIIPPLGNTVAVSGYVKRPAIYELPAGAKSLSAIELLKLAGGGLTKTPLSILYYKTLPTGKQGVYELNDLSTIVVRDGEMLSLRPKEQVNIGVAQVSGQVQLPGSYALSGTGSLKHILSSSDRLKIDSYLPFAVIVSPDRGRGESRFKGVDLQSVLSGKRDASLKTGDKLLVLGNEEIDYLTSQDVLDVLNNTLESPLNSISEQSGAINQFQGKQSSQDQNSKQQCTGLASLARARSSSNTGFFSAAQSALAGRKLKGGALNCPQMYADYPDLLPYLISQSVLITDNVAKPGFYPVVAGADKMGVARYALPMNGTKAQIVSGSQTLNAGSILALQSPQVNVIGHVRYSGARPLSTTRSLRSLLSNDQLLLDNPYMLFGMILRKDPLTRAKQYKAFSPLSILQHQTDEPLLEGDTVFFLSMTDIQKLTGVSAYETEKKDREQNVFDIGSGAQKRTSDLDNRRLIDEYTSKQALGDALTGQSATANRNPFLDAVEQDKRDSARSYDPADPFQTSDITRPKDPDDDSTHNKNNDRFESAPSGNRMNHQEMNSNSQFNGMNSSSEKSPLDKILHNYKDQQNTLQSIAGLSSEQFSEIRDFIRDYTVHIEGAVLRTGYYPVAEQTRLVDLIQIAGGSKQNTDLRSVEVTYGVKDLARSSIRPQRKLYDMTMTQNMSNVVISPKDSIQVGSLYQQVAVGSLRLMGEVRRPGVYQFSKGEKLSSLIERAGGLTREAYPQGAVFSRKSIRENEKRAFERSAFEIDRQVMSLMDNANARKNDGTGAQVQAAKTLSDTLRKAPTIGRTQVTADPALLSAHPEQDILLEDGDILSIPQRPISITVSGEVLAPTSLRQDPDKDLMDYIKMAGGLSRTADTARIFILLPDGQTKLAGTSMWSAYPDNIPPGSTIVIPSDPKPYEWLDFTTGIADLLSKVAISAASLSVISSK